MMPACDTGLPEFPQAAWSGAHHHDQPRKAASPVRGPLANAQKNPFTTRPRFSSGRRRNLTAGVAGQTNTTRALAVVSNDLLTPATALFRGRSPT